jgi:hypothetical protein
MPRFGQDPAINYRQSDDQKNPRGAFGNAVRSGEWPIQMPIFRENARILPLIHGFSLFLLSTCQDPQYIVCAISKSAISRHGGYI